MESLSLKSAGLVLVLAIAVAASPEAAADEPSDDPMHVHDVDDVWAMARGGRLYDNWMEELLRDKPRSNHPAYPSTGKKRGYPT